MSSKNRPLFKKDNLTSIFLSTALVMVFTEFSGVIAVLIDGVISSQFLGSEIYAGISLMRPFSRIVLVLAGFLANGCAAVCARLVTQGKRDEANGTFNFAILLALAGAAVLIVFCLLFPATTLRLCGVPLSKSPELVPFMYEYLHGYLIGVIPLLLIQIAGPVLVMDGGRSVFTCSFIVLCVTDIIGDLLNIFVFRGGAFGMGAATSVGYIMQMLVLLIAVFFRKGYFYPSLRFIMPSRLKDLSRLGLPTFTKSMSATLREVFLNYINIVFALSYFAIAARGIQADLSQLLFCIPTGLGKALVTLGGVYYRANDQRSLQKLYSFALRLGLMLSIAAGVLIFLAAPILTRIYTQDPRVIAMTVFSIRWMAVGMMFDTSIVVAQNYFQGTGSKSASYALIIGERLLLPVAFALILGTLFGTGGVLASMAVSRIFIITVSFLINCVRCRGIPTKWSDVMLLPTDFGGTEEDNIYAEIRTIEDVVRESERTYNFCLEHHAGSRAAFLSALFVEEMTGNVVEHAKRKGDDDICVNYRLFVDHDRICFNIMDLGDRFDPAAFYRMYHNDSPEKHLGIKMVMNMAKEICYYNTYRSNNLTIYLETDPADSAE